MTTVTDYTSFSEIRAALGVSVDEVGDEVLGLTMYSSHLGMEFWTLSDDLEITEDIGDTFVTLMAVNAGSRTRQQKRALSAISLFATYAVARHLGTSLPLMAPKEIGDGKALMSRFTDSPYKSVMAKVEDQYGKIKAEFASALAGLTSKESYTITTSFMGVSLQSTDPVTG